MHSYTLLIALPNNETQQFELITNTSVAYSPEANFFRFETVMDGVVSINRDFIIQMNEVENE